MALPFPPPRQPVLTITQLTSGIKDALESIFSPVWVEGEVSNLARPSSGHLYLTLKDDVTSLKAVIYRAVALRLVYDLRDGLKVVARGRMSVYEPRGEYQLLIEEVQPKGIGPLELAFRQLKEKLSVLGYFDPARKKKVPRLCRRIALLTSGTGSAVRDMLEVLGRRWPASEVWVCPIRVQGREAIAEIAAALQFLNRISPPNCGDDCQIDVILLGRGGGSLEDLAPFNDETVAHAIHRSRIPIVTGIGHEDDLTIADLVADLRALTPTEAAERVVPNRIDVLQWLGTLTKRAHIAARRRFEMARERLADLSNRRFFREPLERIQNEERRLDESSDRLARAVRQRLARAQDQVAAQAGRLEGLSPLNVLARGYSLTRRQSDGALLRDATEVASGERVEIRLHRGHLVGRVETVVPALNKASPLLGDA